ncbi:MAG: RNA polymerase factor sigma-32 [Alphaproteobacteria bacterium]|nr:RNA polymerase factor sigma-32 [Alphaproteobacteria bacterium]
MSEVNELNDVDFSPETNLVRYLQVVASYPILSAEEEFYLTTQYQKTKNPKVAYKIVTSYMKLVVKIVYQYKGYKLPLNEMISEGNIGLLNALNKFDPSKGYRFSTYAMWWIRAYVQKYVINSWSMVKLGTTSAQKKLFFNLRKMKNSMNLSDDRALTDSIMKEIAQTLGVTVQDVLEMNQRMSSKDSSLNFIVSSSDDSHKELIDLIADKKPNQEEIYSNSETMTKRKRMFNEAVKILNQREKDILFKRRLSDDVATLDDLSKIYNISKERVRQIELGSIKKIQKVVGMV